MTESDLTYYRVSNLSHSTTDDCIEYFLRSYLPLSVVYIERQSSGQSEKSAIFAIETVALNELSPELLSAEKEITLPTTTLDDSEISISKASKPQSDSPSLKLYDIQLGTTEEEIRGALEEKGKVAEMRFVNGSKFCHFRMSNSLEAKEVATKGITIRDCFTPVRFDYFQGKSNYNMIPTPRHSGFTGLNYSSNYSSNYSASSGYGSRGAFEKGNDASAVGEGKRVFLHSFGPDFAREEVMQYFSNYGDIVNVKFVMNEQSVNNIPRYGFLEFADGKVGEKVVKMRDHYIGNNVCVAEFSSSNDSGKSSYSDSNSGYNSSSNSGYGGGYGNSERAEKKSHSYGNRGFNSHSGYKGNQNHNQNQGYNNYSGFKQFDNSSSSGGSASGGYQGGSNKSYGGGFNSGRSYSHNNYNNNGGGDNGYKSNSGYRGGSNGFSGNSSFGNRRKY